MTYKLKHPRKKLTPEYWEKREVSGLRKKYHGKLPPVLQITRTAIRRVTDVPERIHTKGKFVQYKDKLGRIKKVTRQGVWIEIFTKPNDKSITFPTKKVVFVSEKKLEKGEVYPFFTRLPSYVSPPFVIA